MGAESILKLILRVVGTSSLAAVIFVAVPTSWMDSIHRDLGLGPLPEGPIVGYLARSTSALYAMLGGVFWLISFDLRRYRAVLIYHGVAAVLFGVALLFIDRYEGLPMWWTAWEGPAVIGFGAAWLLLVRRVPRLDTTTRGGNAS